MKEKRGLAGPWFYIKTWWPFAIPVAVAAAVFWWLSQPTEDSMLGREFATMQQCLDFIEREMGESLKIQSDMPGDVSGKSSVSGRYFRCEQTDTGTRGPLLQGRWRKSE